MRNRRCLAFGLCQRYILDEEAVALRIIAQDINEKIPVNPEVASHILNKRRPSKPGDVDHIWTGIHIQEQLPSLFAVMSFTPSTCCYVHNYLTYTGIPSATTIGYICHIIYTAVLDINHCNYFRVVSVLRKFPDAVDNRNNRS